jgi:CopG family nickel-responsive transcriptional regulator
MSNLIRFGVSIEEDLLTRFDELINQRGYKNRSEAIRDLIRDTLVQSQLGKIEDTEVLGSLTLVYDHHTRDLTERLTNLQHDYHELIVSVMHAHISHDDCMEMLMLRGKASRIKLLADSLLSLKGVKHGKLFTTFPAKEISGKTHHHNSHNHNY